MFTFYWDSLYICILKHFSIRTISLFKVMLWLLLYQCCISLLLRRGRGGSCCCVFPLILIIFDCNRGSSQQTCRWIDRHNWKKNKPTNQTNKQKQTIQQKATTTSVCVKTKCSSDQRISEYPLNTWHQLMISQQTCWWTHRHNYISVVVMVLECCK